MTLQVYHRDIPLNILTAHFVWHLVVFSVVLDANVSTSVRVTGLNRPLPDCCGANSGAGSVMSSVRFMSNSLSSISFQSSPSVTFSYKRNPASIKTDKQMSQIFVFTFWKKFKQIGKSSNEFWQWPPPHKAEPMYRFFKLSSKQPVNCLQNPCRNGLSLKILSMNYFVGELSCSRILHCIHGKSPAQCKINQGHWPIKYTALCIGLRKSTG